MTVINSLVKLRDNVFTPVRIRQNAGMAEEGIPRNPLE